MNPWTENITQRIISVCKSFMRFAFWVCLAINGLMAAIFSIAFTYEFLTHLWQWFRRTIFSNEW